MPIEFDVRTLFFIGAAAASICGAMLWASRDLHAASRSALGWSAAALAAYGLSMLLVALRGSVPDPLSYVVANALGTGAAALMYEGVRRLVGVRPMPWLATGSVAALFGLQAWIGDSAQAYEARLLITSVVQGGFSAACLTLLVGRLRRGGDPAVPLRWAVGFLSVFMLGHATRFVITLTMGAMIRPTGIVVGPGQALMPTLYALAPMVYALILLGLVNGRIAGELWALATVDTLTGVRTRRSFIDEARRVLERLQAGDPPVALMMIDLDRFKQINDRYGHASGDRVLVRFAALLREAVPQGAIVGRYGGEEFCLLVRAASFEAGRVQAQRLCDTVRDTRFGLDQPDPCVTVSIGVAGGVDGSTLEELLLAADRRLYLAKAGGRDRVVVVDRTLAVAAESLPASMSLSPSFALSPAAVHAEPARPAQPVQPPQPGSAPAASGRPPEPVRASDAPDAGATHLPAAPAAATGRVTLPA